MGITKSTLFTAEQNQLAILAKALAHPARIAILQHLLKTNACINNDLVHELGLAQATISQHLRELKETGLIQGNVEGTRLHYCINPVAWQECQGLLNELFNQIKKNGQPDCC